MAGALSWRRFPFFRKKFKNKNEPLTILIYNIILKFSKCADTLTHVVETKPLVKFYWNFDNSRLRECGTLSNFSFCSGLVWQWSYMLIRTLSYFVNWCWLISFKAVAWVIWLFLWTLKLIFLRLRLKAFPRTITITLVHILYNNMYT